MRLKIESDGTPMGTNVLDADTGQKVLNVLEVHWSAIAGEGRSKATIVSLGEPMIGMVNSVVRERLTTVVEGVSLVVEDGGQDGVRCPFSNTRCSQGGDKCGFGYDFDRCCGGPYMDLNDGEGADNG